MNLLQNESESKDPFEVHSKNCDVENIEQSANPLNDGWTEDDVEIPTGVSDTMLTAPDFLEDKGQTQIYNIAPGEGSAPLSIFRDKYSEELAYPGKFVGQKRLIFCFFSPKTATTWAHCTRDQMSLSVD